MMQNEHARDLAYQCTDMVRKGESFPTVWDTRLRDHPLVSGIPQQTVNCMRPVLEIRWRGELAPQCFARLERAVGEGHLAGARVTLHEATRPAVVGDPTPWMAGADDAPLRLAPGGFGQAHEAVNTALAMRSEGAIALLVRSPDRPRSSRSAARTRGLLDERSMLP